MLVPFDPKQVWGRARAPVRVSVEGYAEWPTTVAVYGGNGWIGLRKDQLAEMELALGDEVTMTVTLDDEPRVVLLPEDLDAAIGAAGDARAAYERLSYSHQREYARWVTDAKRPETRARRVGSAVQMLREGRRTPDS